MLGMWSHTVLVWCWRTHGFTLTVNTWPQFSAEDGGQADAVAVLQHGTKHKRHCHNLRATRNHNK